MNTKIKDPQTIIIMVAGLYHYHRIIVRLKMRYARAGGYGLIASILRLLERKGIMILAATLPDYVFGMSTWADKKHPLMILDFNPEKSTVEKLRFTAVHELAHLLLLFPPYYI